MAKCVGFNQITSLGAAVGLYNGLGGAALAAALLADYAEVQAETQAVRYTVDGTPTDDGTARADGTTPTAAVGMVLPAAGSGNPAPLVVRRPLLGAFLAIQAASSAKLNVTFLKTG